MQGMLKPKKKIFGFYSLISRGGGYDILGVNIKKGFLKEFVQFIFFPIA